MRHLWVTDERDNWCDLHWPTGLAVGDAISVVPGCILEAFGVSRIGCSKTRRSRARVSKVTPTIAVSVVIDIGLAAVESVRRIIFRAASNTSCQTGTNRSTRGNP